MTTLQLRGLTELPDVPTTFKLSNPDTNKAAIAVIVGNVMAQRQVGGALFTPHLRTYIVAPGKSVDIDRRTVPYSPTGGNEMVSVYATPVNAGTLSIKYQQN